MGVREISLKPSQTGQTNTEASARTLGLQLLLNGLEPIGDITGKQKQKKHDLIGCAVAVSSRILNLHCRCSLVLPAEGSKLSCM